MAYEKVLFYILTVPFFVRAEPTTGELINPQAGAPFFLATAATTTSSRLPPSETQPCPWLFPHPCKTP
jgi:hypothetical protein